MTASKLAKLRASRAAVIGADGFCLGGVTERKAVEGRSGLGLSVRSISSRTQHLRDRCTDAGDLLLASFRCRSAPNAADAGSIMISSALHSRDQITAPVAHRRR